MRWRPRTAKSISMRNEPRCNKGHLRARASSRSLVPGHRHVEPHEREQRSLLRVGPRHHRYDDVWQRLPRGHSRARHNHLLRTTGLWRNPALHNSTLRIDRGGKFISVTFGKYYAEKCIQWQLTVPYSPQQNGVVELVGDGHDAMSPQGEVNAEHLLRGGSKHCSFHSEQVAVKSSARHDAV